MAPVDKDLRHAGPAPGTLARSPALGRSLRRVDLAKCDTLGSQQLERARAIRAVRLRVDLDVRHSDSDPVVQMNSSHRVGPAGRQDKARLLTQGAPRAS